MLIVEDVWVRHHRRAPWVLRGASLRLEPGRILGLAGPSGAGKSTLAALIAGMLAPDHGTVTVDGALAGRQGKGTRSPRPVQLVGQRPELMMDPRWRIGRILSEAGPSAGPHEKSLVSPSWLERYPHELSGGELHRVNLARAMRVRPAYLIADEMTVSLDALTQAQVWRDLLAWVERDGLGVLAISHDPDLLGAVADETLTLEPETGRIAPSTPGRAEVTPSRTTPA